MELSISAKVGHKLRGKHGVEEQELIQCFANRQGPDLFDTRENHATDPPTRWFISHTNKRRLLKVVYILRDGAVVVRTAYEPNEDELRIYRKFAL